jgi:hypothetical protein
VDRVLGLEAFRADGRFEAVGRLVAERAVRFAVVAEAFFEAFFEAFSVAFFVAVAAFRVAELFVDWRVGRLAAFAIGLEERVTVFLAVDRFFLFAVVLVFRAERVLVRAAAGRFCAAGRFVVVRAGRAAFARRDVRVRAVFFLAAMSLPLPEVDPSL